VKILLSWLREFVDVPGTAAEIGSVLSLRGFAVEGLEPLGDDAVLDVEVTANRPDALCIAGMAREVATACGLPLRTAAETPTLAAGEAGFALTIEADDLCPRYAGALADVRVGPSPDWMQVRLRAAGIRPISNIVDITNYVLLELGQPMHAFDLDRLAGPRIVVRRAATGETMRTLDGQDRRLDPDMLVIADAERPVAIAGVMGGADSEVTDGTRAIVFESACFDAGSVRRTSRRIGLKTEASMRFERGADPTLPAAAMARACALLEQTGSGRARGTIVDRWPGRRDPVRLHLRRARIQGLLGVEIPGDEVRRLLTGLDFALTEGADGWDVVVPPRRVDVRREVDLIEEVARHYGFDRVPATFPVLTAAPPALDPRIRQARQLRAALTGAGFSEAVTFGFISTPAASAFAADAALVPIANPLSESFAVLRPSLLPGLIDAAAHNRRREQRDVRLFEVGARFVRPGGERRAVACLWTGLVGGDHWSGGSRPVDLFDLKGACERVCDVLGIEVRALSHGAPWLVPGRAAVLVSGETPVGVLGQVLPALAERHGFPAGEPIYAAEIDLDAAEVLATVGDIAVTPLPRHPSVSRDLSIVVRDTLPAADIRATIRAAGPPTLVRVREFDRYQGTGIPAGHVSLSLRLTFRAADRTLTDAEVHEAMQAMLGALQQQHGAVQR
jgi:phenylalanyl-tRNA synthetase beta chain